MIIKNITIENFRSYYGCNSLDIGDGLTLVIGSNGDGKTTLFEALEWLFDTADKMPKIDTKYVSKKRIAELSSSEQDKVQVSMSYINEGNERIVQKSFRFTKTLSGEISPSNFNFELYIQNGSEKEVVEGDLARKTFDRDFATSVRKYSMFKGEQELNIFNDVDAMSYLVETFSQIKDFDPYLSFMKLAKDWSESAADNALSKDKKNSKQAASLRSSIREEEKQIGLIDSELKEKIKEATNFESLLQNIEKNKEASDLLVSTNSRLSNLKELKNGALANIKENYNFRLLDEMWILMGFEPIVEEFRELIGRLDKEKRTMQSKHDEEIGAQKYAKKLQEELSHGHVPLSLNIPDENTMREMLDEEYCKVCNRPAPKGSEAYKFMQERLNNFLNSKKVEENQEEMQPLFPNNFIRELADIYSIMHNNQRFLGKLNTYINRAIEENIKLHDKVDSYSSNINEEEERKKQILAQTDGLSEDQLISAYNNITEWWNGRRNAELKSEGLRKKLDNHKQLLEKYRDDLSKISENSSASMYARSSKAIIRILEAFKSSKQKNKNEFLGELERVANEYLELLNINDFRGYARILEKPGNSAEIVLIDSDGTRIFNSNTALKTTMYMSLLFAVSKLTTVKHENDYPLIFDAPTSSFTLSKEIDFFNVISKIKKQTIIFTKSFLVEDANRNMVLDKNRLKQINSKCYRISKKEPFDDRDLSTIHTVITPIKI